MPVPQENLSFVEQASYLLLTMVQHISMNPLFSEVTKLTLKRAYGNSELFNSSLY
jgi:hypothetical protein